MNGFVTRIPDTRWIPGYEGHYRVTDDGRVLSYKSRGHGRDGRVKALALRLLGKKKWRGGSRPTVHLCRDKSGTECMVHRLVLLAFVGPCPEGQEVRYIDGNVENNRFENLCYGTREENTEDRKATGTWGWKLTEEQAREIKRLYETGQGTQKAIGEMFGVVRETISRIVCGKCWKWLDE